MGCNKNLKEEIKKFFKGEVENDEETLMKYSHDASLLEVRPKLVLFPKDSEDIKNLVKWINENKEKYPDLSITARCAGTDMSGGAIGESIILDFTRYMNKLISFTDNKITVQPGMFYRDFEKLTLEKGFILPCFTASKTINAMGGMFGNNSAGERTLKYGKTEDYILETKVIFSDGNEYAVKPLSKLNLDNKVAQKDFEGNIYKNIFELINKNEAEIKLAKPNVHKNSAGYYVWNIVKNQDSKNFSDSDFFDLNKLLVGSQGTLGIATEITFRLVPDNKHSKLVAIFMKDLISLGELVDEILELNPETLESYDDKTIKLAVQFFHDFLKAKGFFGILKVMWGFMPEFFMLFTGGFPKLILLAEFAGDNEADVNEKCVKLREKIKHFKLKVHIVKSEIEADKYWDIRRESFTLLREHVKGMRTAPFIDDIIVRSEFLPKFLPELNLILSKYKLTYTLAGHAGDGNFHIIPLMDFRRSDTAKIIMELSEKVYDLVMKYHGSITAEHNDGLIRTPYLKKMYGENIIKIFAGIKKIFDPRNIFNSGKKVAAASVNGLSAERAGTKEYIATHIAVERDTTHRI